MFLNQIKKMCKIEAKEGGERIRIFKPRELAERPINKMEVTIYDNLFPAVYSSIIAFLKKKSQ